MSKIFKPFILLFKLVYHIIDFLIVVPISRFIYRIGELSRANSGRLEKLLNRPNILVYISLFCAIVVFVLVDTRAISLVTEQAEILPDQRVNVIYNEEAFVVEGVPETVDIVLIGRRSDLYLAKQLGEHEVVLDLTGYNVGTHRVRLRYNRSIDTINYKLDPSTITIKISEKVSAVKSLTYELLNKDKLDSKLNISSVTLDRNEVIVKGSEEALEAVATVKALVDLNAAGFTDKGTFTVDSIQLVAYDHNGAKLTNVEIVPTRISASVVVDSFFAELPVRIVTNGNLRVGFAIATATSTVARVGVYGDQEAIERLTHIEAIIDIDGLGADRTFPVTLVRPAGVRYMTDTTTSVAITLEQETTREFSGIQVQFTNLGNAFNVGAVNDQDRIIGVMARGVASVITRLEQNQIIAEIDLSGLAVGTHEVPVIVRTDDVRIRLQPMTTAVRVRITHRN